MRHITILFLFATTGVFSCKTGKNISSEPRKTLQPDIYNTAYGVSARTKMFLTDFISELNIETKEDEAFMPSQKLIDKYFLQKIQDTYVISGFIKTTKGFDKSKLENLGISLGPPAGEINTVKIPLGSLEDFLLLENIEYFEIAERAQTK